MSDILKSICVAAWYDRRITDVQIGVLVTKGKLTEGEESEILASPQKPV